MSRAYGKAYQGWGERGGRGVGGSLTALAFPPGRTDLSGIGISIFRRVGLLAESVQSLVDAEAQQQNDEAA